MNIKDFKWTEKRFGTRFANILKKLGGLSKDDTDGSIEYKDEQGNITKLVTDSNFSSLLAKNGLIEVKWQELKDKRDASKLIPGNLYRITDYQCTTTQENTRSAGHQFDIILLALSENKLAEEGWAMMHDNIYDVTFSDGVTKKCYCYVTFSGYDGEDYYEDWNLVDVDTLLGFEKEDIYLTTSDGIVKDEANKAIIITPITGIRSTRLSETGLTYNYFQNSNLSAWKVWYCLDNDTARFAWADNVNGTGVIYRLIDEWNNDVPYDFKNIQFIRPMTDGGYDPDGEDTWVYTFTITYDGSINDASLLNYREDLEFSVVYAEDNYINPYIDSGYYLPYNVFISDDVMSYNKLDCCTINNTCLGLNNTIMYGTANKDEIESSSIYLGDKKVLTKS